MSIEVKDLVNKGFECGRCGSCCEKVAPNIEDIYRIETVAQYNKEYFLDLEKYDIFLKDVNGDCIFLTEAKLCSIYEARPLICQLYPFKVLPSAEAENKIVFELSCPVNIKGGKEYPACSGGLIGKASFTKDGNLLSIARKYTEILLKEYSAHLIIEKVQPQILIAREVSDIKKERLEYIQKLKSEYDKMEINQAISTLKNEYKTDWFNKLRDWFR